MKKVKFVSDMFCFEVEQDQLKNGYLWMEKYINKIKSP